MVVNIIERNNKTQKEMDAAVNNQIYVKDQKRNPLQSLLRSKKEKMQDDRIMHVDTADKVEKKVISLWGKPIPQKDVYSQKDAENLARIISYIIRNEFKNKIDTETPILALACELGIVVGKGELSNTISGYIKVHNGEKLICVNKNETWEHQRFVIAHEIGHFLMDSKAIDNASKEYMDIYFHSSYQIRREKSEQDSRADIFAAELLMPRELFIKKYNYYTNYKYNPYKKRMITIGCLSKAFKTKASSVERRIYEIISEN